MDRSAGTLAAARVLMGMAERETSCALNVHAGPRVVRLSVCKGRLYAVEGTGHALLGDMLLGHGVDDPRLALRDDRDIALLGLRLVAQGVVSAAQLSRGLRALHVERLRWLFAHTELRVGALAALPSLGARLRGSVPLGGAVLDALLHAHDAAPSRPDAGGWPALCARGQRAVSELFGELASLRPARAPSVSDSHERQREVLVALGCCVAPGAGGSYTELVCMRRELARGGALRVLALPAGATRAEARKRLRTLARRLHPDLFAAAYPGLAREASDVLAELTRAADALTWGRSRTV